MSVAKKALYAAVGAGEVALERAKALPKRASQAPELLSKTASKLREIPGKASSALEDFARRGEKVLAKPKSTEKPARKLRAKTEDAETPAAVATPQVLAVEETPVAEVVG